MLSETIIIKAPAGTKARWVRQSQALGLKLSDWVIQSVDRPANKHGCGTCPRSGSTLVVSDGPGLWQCAQCGLAS